jgi:hypothetical protein
MLLVSGVNNALRFSANLFGALSANKSLNGPSGSPFMKSAQDLHELASQQDERAPQYEGDARVPLLYCSSVPRQSAVPPDRLRVRPAPLVGQYPGATPFAHCAFVDEVAVWVWGCCPMAYVVNKPTAAIKAQQLLAVRALCLGRRKIRGSGVEFGDENNPGGISAAVTLINR